MDSKNGQIGVKYCDYLYQLGRKFRQLSPSKRKKQSKYSKPIVEELLEWDSQDVRTIKTGMKSRTIISPANLNCSIPTNS